MEGEANLETEVDDGVNVGTVVAKRAVTKLSDVYLPTAEEIAAACAEIQAEWTDDERYLRLRGWRKQ